MMIIRIEVPVITVEKMISDPFSLVIVPLSAEIARLAKIFNRIKTTMLEIKHQ